MNKLLMIKVQAAIDTEEDVEIKAILQSWLYEQIVKQELMFE